MCDLDVEQVSAKLVLEIKTISMKRKELEAKRQFRKSSYAPSYVWILLRCV